MKRLSTAPETKPEQIVPRSGQREKTEICPMCCGTGLVCGVEPTISPGACCVDYANALCPECGGRGKKP